MASTKSTLLFPDAPSNAPDLVGDTDPPADIYAEAERLTIEAHKLLAAREQAVYEAHHEGTRLEVRLRRGDESVTATDLAGSEQAVRRAELLVQHAKNVVLTAERTGPFRPAVALAVLSSIATGLDVERENVTLVDDAASTGTAPLTVTVREVERATRPRDLGGRIKGTAEVVFWRTERHQRADWSALQAVLDSAGHHAMVASRATRRGPDGLIGDIALIDATEGVWPEVITMPKNLPSGGWCLNSFARAVLAQAQRSVPDRVDLTAGTPTGRRTVTGNKVATVVELTFTGKGARDYTSGKDHPVGGVGAVLAAAPTDLIGRSFDDLGTLVKVEALPMGESGKERWSEVHHKVRCTFTAELQR